jgi:hypothetical protein
MRPKGLNRVHLLAAALWLTAPSAQARDAAFAGPGASTCAEYADLARTSPTLADEIYISWAQGFLSAVNAEILSRFVLNLDSDHYPVSAQTAFLREYCDKHPLAVFVSAVHALWGELMRQRVYTSFTPPGGAQ